MLENTIASERLKFETIDSTTKVQFVCSKIGSCKFKFQSHEVTPIFSLLEKNREIGVDIRKIKQ